MYLFEKKNRLFFGMLFVVIFHGKKRLEWRMLLLIAGTWEDQSGVYIEALGRVVSFLEPLPSIFIGDYKPYTRIATNAVHAQQDRRMLSFYPSFVIINTRCNTRHETSIKAFIVFLKSLDHDIPIY